MGMPYRMMQRKRTRSPRNKALSKPEGCGPPLSKIRRVGAGLSTRLVLVAGSAGAGAATFVLSAGALGLTLDVLVWTLVPSRA